MVYYFSFPPEERESELVILKSVSTDRGMAYALKEGNITKGIATVHLLKDVSAIFLVYLAIIPSLQNKGLGSEFFKFVEENSKKRLQELNIEPKGMVWEVEKSARNINGEPSDYKKRKAFFDKNGGITLSCKYIQPPVDGKNLVEMFLMTKGPLTSDIPINDLIRAIYFDKYYLVNNISKETLDSLLAKII